MPSFFANLEPSYQLTLIYPKIKKKTIKKFRQQHLKSKFGQGPALEIQVGDEDVNKVHDLAMEMIPSLTMKDKFQVRYPRTNSVFIGWVDHGPSVNTC